MRVCTRSIAKGCGCQNKCDAIEGKLLIEGENVPAWRCEGEFRLTLTEIAPKFELFDGQSSAES